MSENLNKSTDNESLENNFLLFIDSNIHSLNHVVPPRSSDGKHDYSTSESDAGAT